MTLTLTSSPFSSTGPTVRTRYGDSDDQARGGRKTDAQLTTNQVPLPMNSGLAEPAGIFSSPQQSRFPLF